MGQGISDPLELDTPRSGESVTNTEYPDELCARGSKEGRGNRFLQEMQAFLYQNVQ